MLPACRQRAYLSTVGFHGCSRRWASSGTLADSGLPQLGTGASGPSPRGSGVGALPRRDVMPTTTEGGGGDGSDSDGRCWGWQRAAHLMRRTAGSGGGSGAAPRGSVYNSGGLGFGRVFLFLIFFHRIYFACGLIFVDFSVHAAVGIGRMSKSLLTVYKTDFCNSEKRS